MSSAIGGARAGLSVLVVDDSRTNRLFLSKMVRAVDRSHTVLQASDGVEGLAVLRARLGLADSMQAQQSGDTGSDIDADATDHDSAAAAAPKPAIARSGPAVDLILLDFSMPRMSGPEMARELRADADPRLSAIPIVGVTGNALPADQKSFRACGAQEVLLKPVRRAQVAGILDRVPALKAALA